MTQPNQDWNPPRGPRSRHPRGRGQVSSPRDSTPAPQTLGDQNESHNAQTQNPQRDSVSLNHHGQSIPYWDDSNGAIHDIPSSPPWQSGRSCAQAINGQARRTQNQLERTPIQHPPQAAFNNPYLDIVGDGPYGRNQAFYGKYRAQAAQFKPAVEENQVDRRDFAPYFDATDSRNGADLASPKKHGFRDALGVKEVNQKLRQETTDTIRAATEKCGKMNAGKLSEPRPEPKAFVGHQPPKPSTVFKSKFEISILAKTPHLSAVPPSQPASHQWPGTSPVIEALSPLEAISKIQPTQPKHKRTSTLDRILNLRAEEQAKALATLKSDNPESRHPRGYQRHAPHALSRKISDQESQRLAEHSSWEEKQQASESIPKITTPEQGKWEDICMRNDPAVSVKEDDANSSVYSSDDNAQIDEIDRLSNAIAGLHPYQDVPLSPRGSTAFTRNSAVPEGLDMSKIEAGKGEAENRHEAQWMQQVPREKTLEEAQAELLEYFGVEHTDEKTALRQDKAGVQTFQESSLPEPYAMTSEESYEQVGEEEELMSEQNGVKRRWYKGFRKT